MNHLNRMDNEKTPNDKLKCVYNLFQIINNSIKFCSGNNENAGTDDIMPILYYIILKSKPKRMFSSIK
jgi:hypothetical protein